MYRDREEERETDRQENIAGMKAELRVGHQMIIPCK